MSAINLFWQLNVSDKTKYLFIVLIIICILTYCYFSKNNKNKKKKKKTRTVLEDEYYKEYVKRRNLTPCHKRYMNCVKDNIKNNTNDFCYPCLNNGLKPDFFYDPETKEWLSRD
jgi:hypothetical protein